MSECKHGKHSVFCKYCDAETVEKYSQARKSDSSNDRRVLEFEEGKYRIELYDRGYIAYRHGELWPVANHSKLIYAMALDMEAAQSRHAAEREELVNASKLGVAKLKDCLEAFGDCDHSVGICNCDIKRAIDAMNSVLLSDSGSQG
jgi:hypothetical protein